MTSDQITSLIRTLLAAGGPIAGLLANIGLDAGTVNNILTVALIVLPPIIAGVWGYLHNSNASKLAGVKSLSTEDANAAVESLPTTAKNAIKLATMDPASLVHAAAAQSGVTKIEIASDAAPALSAVAEDPSQPKVVSQTASKG